MEFITIFREFGYPAVVTGALLWIYLTDFKKILAKLHEILVKLTSMEASISECRKDISKLEQRK